MRVARGARAGYPNPVMRSLLALALLALASAACSSSDSGSTGSSSKTVQCTQKSGADGDKDCADKGASSRKLDCADAAQFAEAIQAGCVPQDPNSKSDNDVCCPTSISGKPESTGLTCTEPADTLTDSDCMGTPRPRKLDCVSAAEQNQGILLGCAPESPGNASDFDLCCPMDVRGLH